MKLSQLEAVKAIKSPCLKDEIEKGKEYESALRIYTEEKFKEGLINESAWKKFNSFIGSILSAKKFVRVQDFIKYPLPVVNIGKGVLKDIYKVFDSRNSYFDVQHLNKIGVQQVSEMLNSINVHQWIVTKGKEVLKNKPNSIVVVDKDGEGNPYLICVDSSRLVDLKIKEDSTLEYIVFIHSVVKTETGQNVTFYSVYDDEYYRVYKRVAGGEPELVEGMEIPHNIGYCPARMFMSEKLNSEDEYNRAVPLSPVLSKLEEWQQFEIYKYYTDHYGAFPIIERPNDDCSVDGCNNGKVETEHYDEDNVMYKKYHDCPVCKDKQIIGPGTEIGIQPRQDKDEVDSSGIFKFINPDIKNNEYLKKHLKDTEVEINLKTVGENEILKVQAINEDQVAGSFEAKKTILINWKTQFDKLYNWTVQTMVKALDVGAEVIVHANFGTEFYLLTEEELQNLYNNAIKYGLPLSEIDMIYNQLMETKYRGNPTLLNKMKIIRLLDTDPYSTPEKSLLKKQNGMLSSDDLIIKANLIKFVDRFELENGSIVEFGKEIDFNKKIEIIKKEFLKYIKDGQFKDETKQVEGL